MLACSVASREPVDLHFGNVSLVGEHGSINSGTRTADALQPVLHVTDFVPRSLDLTNHSALSGVLHPAAEPQTVSMILCVHPEAHTLHVPEDLKVHGDESVFSHDGMKETK